MESRMRKAGVVFSGVAALALAGCGVDVVRDVGINDRICFSDGNALNIMNIKTGEVSSATTDTYVDRDRGRCLTDDYGTAVRMLWKPTREKADWHFRFINFPHDTFSVPANG